MLIFKQLFGKRTKNKPMVSIETFRALSLAFDEAVEQPHFEKISFRVNKKIFATIDIKNSRAVVKLPVIEQSVFCSFNKSIIYPVPGTWGTQGWTIIELTKVGKNMLKDALATSYCSVAPKRLAEKYQKK
jgi:predicted DNA-binding protein (MmcQ/YjbR family)